MALTFTPEVSDLVLTNTTEPTVDSITTATSFTEIPNFTGTVNIPAGALYQLGVLWQNYISSNPGGAIEFRLADGVTVVASSALISTTAVVEFNSPTIQNDTGSAITLIRIFTSVFNAGGTPEVTVFQDSFKFVQSLTNNTGNIQGIKWNIVDLEMFGTNENIFGFTGNNKLSEGITTIPINGLVANIIWSANSGNMLWGWNGNRIGLEP